MLAMSCAWIDRRGRAPAPGRCDMSTVRSVVDVREELASAPMGATRTRHQDSLQLDLYPLR